MHLKKNKAKLKKSKTSSAVIQLVRIKKLQSFILLSCSWVNIVFLWARDHSSMMSCKFILFWPPTPSPLSCSNAACLMCFLQKAQNHWRVIFGNYTLLTYHHGKLKCRPTLQEGNPHGSIALKLTLHTCFLCLRIRLI